MTNRQDHWQQVYETKAPDAVSWYQDAPDVSLELIDSLKLKPDAAIIDVGAGASVLVDHLLARSFHDVTLVDLSSAALAHTKARLGKKAEGVRFLTGDVTALALDASGTDVWHDRAVLHFLTDEADRRKYRNILDTHLKPGGHAIIATFAVGGPEKCSGLPVRQYDAAGLMAFLGDAYRLLEERRETHKTPWGSDQTFAYFLVRKAPVSMAQMGPDRG